MILLIKINKILFTIKYLFRFKINMYKNSEFQRDAKTLIPMRFTAIMVEYKEFNGSFKRFGDIQIFLSILI